MTTLVKAERYLAPGSPSISNTMTYGLVSAPGNGRVLVISAQGTPGGATTIDVTFNGVAVPTFHTESIDGGRAANVNLCYVLEADLPVVGSYDIVMTHGANSAYGAIQVLEFTGVVDQVTPLKNYASLVDTGVPNGGTRSVTLSGASGDLGYLVVCETSGSNILSGSSETSGHCVQLFANASGRANHFVCEDATVATAAVQYDYLNDFDGIGANSLVLMTFSLDGAATGGVDGDGDITLPSLVVAGTATAGVVSGVTAAGDVTLPSMQATASADTGEVIADLWAPNGDSYITADNLLAMTGDITEVVFKDLRIDFNDSFSSVNLLSQGTQSTRDIAVNVIGGLVRLYYKGASVFALFPADVLAQWPDNVITGELRVVFNESLGSWAVFTDTVALKSGSITINPTYVPTGSTVFIGAQPNTNDIGETVASASQALKAQKGWRLGDIEVLVDGASVMRLEIPTGTATIIPDTIGSNDGTLRLGSGDGTDWIPEKTVIGNGAATLPSLLLAGTAIAPSGPVDATGVVLLPSLSAAGVANVSSTDNLWIPNGSSYIVSPSGGVIPAGTETVLSVNDVFADYTLLTVALGTLAFQGVANQDDIALKITFEGKVQFTYNDLVRTPIDAAKSAELWPSGIIRGDFKLVTNEATETWAFYHNNILISSASLNLNPGYIRSVGRFWVGASATDVDPADTVGGSRPPLGWRVGNVAVSVDDKLALLYRMPTGVTTVVPDVSDGANDGTLINGTGGGADWSGIILDAYGIATLPSLVVAGSATDSVTTVIGDGDITLPSLVVAGSATDSTSVTTAAGDITLPSLVVAGSASDTSTVVSASGAVVLPSLVVAGTATDSTPAITASGAVALPSLVVVGSATDTTSVNTATGAISLPSLVLTGIGGEVTPDFFIIIDVEEKILQTTLTIN